MNEHIEYSFEADVTRLLSGINQGIKALDEFSEVVELASTNFDLSNKELDKLTASSVTTSNIYLMFSPNSISSSLLKEC